MLRSEGGCDERPCGFEVDLAVFGEEGGEGGLFGERAGRGGGDERLDLEREWSVSVGSEQQV